VWHIALPQCDSSLLYAYRVMGENQDKNNAPSAVGHKFDEVRQSQQQQQQQQQRWRCSRSRRSSTVQTA
jgi:hypothetical protein